MCVCGNIIRPPAELDLVGMFVWQVLRLLHEIILTPELLFYYTVQDDAKYVQELWAIQESYYKY